MGSGFGWVGLGFWVWVSDKGLGLGSGIGFRTSARVGIRFWAWIGEVLGSGTMKGFGSGRDGVGIGIAFQVWSIQF